MSCPDCGDRLVYDHIENKFFCLKCRKYPDQEKILMEGGKI